jgi:hypothetical protein
MWAIFHSIVGINDDKVNNCEQVGNILKIVKRKYKAGLGKKVSLDSLCGNKYYRNELTAIKYIQAKKILDKWRAFKTNQIKRKEQEMMLKLANHHHSDESGDETSPDPSNKNSKIGKRKSTANKSKAINRNEEADFEVDKKRKKNPINKDYSMDSSEFGAAAPGTERGMLTERETRNKQIQAANKKKFKK